MKAEALPAARRDAGVGGREQPHVGVERQILEDHLDPRVAALPICEQLLLTLDLSLDQQPDIVALDPPKRL